MINTDEYREQLRAECCYRSPDKIDKGFWFGLLGQTDFFYRCALFGIVARGAKLGRSGKWDRNSWLNLSLGMARCVEGCGGRFDISGCESLLELNGSPVVIVANHMSLLETFALPSVILPFLDLTFVVKESLTTMPLFRDVMKGTKPISVGRKNPRDDLKRLMELGPVAIAAGKSIVIFPQSTRSTVFNPSTFNTLGVKLAKRAGVPVVPLALKTDMHGMGGWIRDFGPVDRSKTVYFKFGPAISVEGSGRDAHAACIRFISESLQEWGGAVEADA
ncbi:MAG: 1-acyl-sn-glycerol-3-phosphate acyltransferase [Verrucomicrobia bacterium]|jgi:1-acyl-sn-glycerol-3-phosphate acyltransferase|nr:1-acyl-sn-glycerol-3-phosphate acyltransferase [Verrucomicrobiota bacterium]